MLLTDTHEKIEDKAVVMEFASVLQLRKSLESALKEHNLTQENMDSVVAHSLACVLVKNFCIAAQEATRFTPLSLSNSTIASVKYLVEPLCSWFVSVTGLIDKLYHMVPGGDMFVTVRVTGARIVFVVSPGQRRHY